MMTNAEKMQLLWSRAGFGMPLAGKANTNVEELTEDLLHPPVPLPIEVISAEEWTEFYDNRVKKGNTPEAMAFQMKLRSFREKAGDLGLLWLRQMATTGHPLQEKMALFWHGHFATRVDNPYYDQLLLQTFRAGGLGNFKDLLFAVSKSPAMLAFLNNQQNKKQHPNENFARELLELFTLGRGNYNEQDVKEAARAFTGWSFDEEALFTIRTGQHDNGIKTFLGRTGDFSGDDILNMLLERRETAEFVTRKVYRFFVNEEHVDDTWLVDLSGSFYDSGYDIPALMRAIFTSEKFYQQQNRGARIKAPVELLAGMQRHVPATFDKERTLINLQRVLGQQLFFPPNVGGWPGGRSWIDASTLATRMMLPEAIYGSRELELRAKDADAEMGTLNKQELMPESPEGKFKAGKAEIDWSTYLAYWSPHDEDELPHMLADYLLAVPVTDAQLKTALQYSSARSKEELIKTLTIRLMGLPEYQLA